MYENLIHRTFVINFVTAQFSLISNPFSINPSDPKENKLYLLKELHQVD